MHRSLPHKYLWFLKGESIIPSTVSSSSSLDDSSLTGMLDDVILAKEIGAAAGAGAPNPGGGANGLTVFEGYVT